MTDILGIQTKYITCPRVLNEVVVRHDQWGRSEIRFTVVYQVMDENKVWHKAIGVFNHSDFPDWKETWKPTEWLAIEALT